MEILVTAKGLTKTFGARTLFSDIDFTIEAGDRIGLIGPNGAGKSTLLTLMTQQTSPDAGELAFRRGLKVGFLSQKPELPRELSVEEAILEGGDEALAREILSRLHLRPVAEQKVGTLSGGWQKRVALGRELVKGPELLLLDEPTNHLDIESIIWLESFLARSPFAVVTVTHDRMFLQKISNRILELDKRNPRGLLSVAGDYAEYLKRKEELLETQQIHETKLRNKLRRETEWLRRGPKARTTKQQARINAAGELAADVQELKERNQHRGASFDFQSTDKKPKRLLEVTGIKKSFGERVLFSGLNLLIAPGDRIGLLGVNGCGKSTLIKVLLGLEKPDSGVVFLSEHLKPAYFEQNRESLDPELTLRRAVCPHGDEVNYRGRMIHVHGYLDRFLFRKDQADLQLKRLSGGEQARVLIARLMLKEANLLVLDEPTNDLDVETLDVLEECLTDFDGAVLLVTHDRYFLDQVATEIVAFPPPESGRSQLITFASLSQWQNWQDNLEAPAAKTSKETKKDPVEKKPKRLGFNETRELQSMEGNIEKAEKKLADLQTEAADPAIMSNAKRLSELYADIAAAQAEVERLYARWNELEAMK